MELQVAHGAGPHRAEDVVDLIPEGGHVVQELLDLHKARSTANHCLDCTADLSVLRPDVLQSVALAGEDEVHQRGEVSALYCGQDRGIHPPPAAALPLPGLPAPGRLLVPLLHLPVTLARHAWTALRWWQ